jgi:hypothetical protein
MVDASAAKGRAASKTLDSGVASDGETSRLPTNPASRLQVCERAREPAPKEGGLGVGVGTGVGWGEAAPTFMSASFWKAQTLRSRWSSSPQHQRLFEYCGDARNGGTAKCRQARRLRVEFGTRREVWMLYHSGESGRQADCALQVPAGLQSCAGKA